MARSRPSPAGIAARVVSMPSVEWFDEQTQEYRFGAPGPPARGIESRIAMPWFRFVPFADQIVSLALRRVGRVGALRSSASPPGRRVSRQRAIAK